MDTLLTIIPFILCGLLLLSGFFSATETAFMSANTIKLKNMAAKGHRGAARVLRLLDNYDKLISTILIGNNVVNIVSSALATLIFVRILGHVGVSIASAIMTVLVLLFGEITPKTMAREAPESFAIFCAPFIYFFLIVFTPLNFLTIRWKRLISSAFHIKNNRSITESELLTFVEEVRQEGGINEREEVMIKRTIDFDEISAHEICTPRVDIEAVPVTADRDIIDEKFRTTRYSRLPVYDGSIDNIIGLIILKDFYYEVIGCGRSPKDIIKNVVYIPGAMKAPRILKTLQEKKAHFAVILDEFGGTMGIVSIEDIVEEIVGEIWDEHDEIIHNISKNDRGTVTILGRTVMEELRAYLNIQEAKIDNPYGTLATWVLEKSGGNVALNSVFDFYGVSLRVTKIHHNRVIEMTIKKR